MFSFPILLGSISSLSSHSPHQCPTHTCLSTCTLSRRLSPIYSICERTPLTNAPPVPPARLTLTYGKLVVQTCPTSAGHDTYFSKRGSAPPTFETCMPGSRELALGSRELAPGSRELAPGSREKFSIREQEKG